MRKLPMILSAVFLAIQLSRVADFVAVGLSAGQFLGWMFAIGIGVGVFVSSYWTRQSINRADEKEDKRDKRARGAAWMSLIMFILLDGTFNLAETLRVLVDQSLRLYAIIYGVSPTIIAAALGSLQGRIDRLPVPPRKSRTGSILDAITAAIEGALAPARGEQVASNEPVKTRKPLPQVARKPMTDESLLAFLQATPGASQQQVADHFGVTRQAVGPRIKKLYEVKQ
jgi:hypothetical protein